MADAGAERAVGPYGLLRLRPYGRAMTDSAAPPPDPGGPPRNRTWPIAFGVTAALLVIALVALLLVSRSKDDTETSNAGTTVDTTVLPTPSTTVRSPTTTRAPSTTATSAASTSSPTSADSRPTNLECSPAKLRQAMDQSVLASNATVSQYGCTLAPVGDQHDAYAWARFTAPMSQDVFALYSGYVGTEPATPQPVEWTLLTAGTDWFCQQHVPVAACDAMPGVLR